MFSLQKRVFAGKQALRQEPFCPVFTNENGLLSLQRNPSYYHQPGVVSHARPSKRDGKYRS